MGHEVIAWSLRFLSEFFPHTGSSGLDINSSSLDQLCPRQGFLCCPQAVSSFLHCSLSLDLWELLYKIFPSAPASGCSQESRCCQLGVLGGDWRALGAGTSMISVNLSCPTESWETKHGQVLQRRKGILCLHWAAKSSVDGKVWNPPAPGLRSALKHVAKAMGKHLEIFKLCLICHYYFPTKQAVQKFSRGRSVSDDQEFLGLYWAAWDAVEHQPTWLWGIKSHPLDTTPRWAFALHCITAGKSCKLHWFPFKSQQFPVAFPVAGGSRSWNLLLPESSWCQWRWHCHPRALCREWHHGHHRAVPTAHTQTQPSRGDLLLPQAQGWA